MSILQLAALAGAALAAVTVAAWRRRHRRGDDREITQDELVAWFRRNRA
jgi:hypothetical protein